MRIYVTTRFKGSDNKAEIELLCNAVKQAGLEDFSFVRDVENYQKTFDDPKDLWERSVLEIQNSDALLIDVSDSPTGGRVVEVGIAYALAKPVIVIAKDDTRFKGFFNGIAATITYYNTFDDIVPVLKKYVKTLAN